MNTCRSTALKIDLEIEILVLPEPLTLEEVNKLMQNGISTYINQSRPGVISQQQYFKAPMMLGEEQKKKLLALYECLRRNSIRQKLSCLLNTGEKEHYGGLINQWVQESVNEFLGE